MEEKQIWNDVVFNIHYYWLILKNVYPVEILKQHQVKILSNKSVLD